MFGGKTRKIRRGKDPFAEEILKYYEEYCIWGGYPAVVLTKNLKERRKVLGEIYDNYILKDVRTLLQLASENNLYRLSQHLAVNIGGIVVYENLCAASGLDYRNVKKHMRILQETFVCKELKPYFNNRHKELSRNPKMYFMDMGFRNSLLDNMGGLAARPDAGKMAENTVFIMLNSLRQDLQKLNYWRTKSGAEMDFILHTPLGLVPIEVKYSPCIEERLSRSFVSFLDKFKPAMAVVLNKDFYGRVKNGGTDIIFIPIYYL